MFLPLVPPGRTNPISLSAGNAEGNSRPVKRHAQHILFTLARAGPLVEHGLGSQMASRGFEDRSGGQIVRAFRPLHVAMLFQHDAEVVVERGSQRIYLKTGVAHVNGALPFARRVKGLAQALIHRYVVRVKFDCAAECLDLTGTIAKRLRASGPDRIGR